MAWNNHRRRTRAPQEKAAIGDSHVENAVFSLQQTQQRAMTIMTEYSARAEDTVRAMFSADHVAIATNAKGVVTDPAGWCTVYECTLDTVPGGGFTLTINFSNLSMMPIADEHRVALPLEMINFVNAAAEVHFQYEDVKHVLRYLNREATPGAIRYYWPTALKLCPKAPAFTNLQEVPARHSNPPHIAQYAMMFRATSTVMAAAAMLPEAAPRPRKEMWLTFGSRQVQRHGIEYRTDSMNYYI